VRGERVSLAECIARGPGHSLPFASEDSSTRTTRTVSGGMTVVHLKKRKPSA
jgi:hypothetical protein